MHSMYLGALAHVLSPYIYVKAGVFGYIQWRSKESCHLRNVIKWRRECSFVGAIEKSLNSFEYVRK